MQPFIRRFRYGMFAGAAAGALSLCTTVNAQTAAQEYDIAAQDLGASLRVVARQSGRELMAPSEILKGKQAPALEGHYTADEAIEALLKGSGLVAEISPDIVIIRGRSQPSGSEVADSAGDGDIVVTGSRIRGAESSSPVIIMGQNEMRNAGQSNLGEAVRSLPQSFTGGQNPGVGIGAGGSPANENLGSGSTINLRGLGQDATLTLLNGHRLAYNVGSQGIDVSAIPLAAVDRIEIVADGASALYGSDAVGGVANIILKRDYEGLWTSARFGASTDGGNEQQQYSVVTGTRWGTGGIMATYDFERDTPIVAGQRSYTDKLYPDETLLRFQRHHNVLLSGYQALTSDLEFAVDGYFNKRWSNYNLPASTTGDYRSFGIFGTSSTTSYSVAPSLRLQLPARWTATLAGVYAEDRTRYGSDFYVGGAVVSPTRGCYCNNFRSIEASAEGPLGLLPGGEARLALGGGYRVNGLHAFRTVGSSQDIDVNQDTYYGFAELYVPLVSAEQGIALVNSLSVSGAIRYEDYPGIDKVASPKVGIVYSPLPELDLKGSWGKSFKAPTLYQQYSVQYSSLYPVAAVGGSGYPATATAVLLDSANPSLKPERATTWALTLATTPRALSGFHAEFSYFNIRYRDRVATPIPNISSALAGTAYSDLVNSNPSDAEKQGVTTGSNYSFYNYTGPTFDPANIVAIIDNRYRNIARQSIGGVDISLRYTLDTTGMGTFTLTGNGTYLDSSQTISTGQPVLALAGTIFNPPHYRGRGGVAWDQGALTLTSYVNYIGGVSDTRRSPAVHVGSMTTLDLTARYRVENGPRAFNNMELILTAQNILNDKPSIIRTSVPYSTPYDSTNYSAIGRFVSFTISKRW